MRVIDIIKVQDKLKPFKVVLPNEPPKVNLPINPSLDEVFKSFSAFNIPYKNLTIQEMQSVVKLLQHRFRKDPDSIIVLQTLSSHLNQLKVWLEESF